MIAFAATAWSLAGVLQRGLKMDTPTQASGRAFFATVALGLVCVFEARRTGVPLVRFCRAIGWAGVAMAVCLAGASASFIYALNHATVATVLFIQALAPLVAVVLSRIFLGERATNRTWWAMALAVAGVALMVGSPGDSSAGGLVASVVMMALFATSIVLTRYARAVSMVPGSALSQFLVFIVALPFADFSQVHSGGWVRLVALGVFQMGLGQLCFVVGARLITASETALITLLEVVLGPIWVYLVYRENPGTATLVGGVIVLAAVIFQTTERGAAPVPDIVSTV
jgi:drug/metabolite transporter (DMT)-like permease